jgi:3-phosphoshikimate 1-carboxyvinyltransferase
MNPLPDLLPIRPFVRPARGTVALPGSKSITNRALLLAAMGAGPVDLTAPLFSEDTRLMVEALRTLGFDLRVDDRRRSIRIEGAGGAVPAPSADLFVGLAGTVARFLTAFCAAAAGGTYRIDGSEAMRQRPMKGLVDALRALGADIRCPGREGSLPLEIHARGLAGGTVALDAGASSQMLSALLMVAPLARNDLEIALAGGVREPFVRMTAAMMEQFGQPPLQWRDAGRLAVAHALPYRLPSAAYPVEPDASAASYFLALPLAAGGHVRLPGARRPGQGLQGDTRFVEVVEQAGLTLSAPAGGEGLEVSLAPGAPRRGVARDFRDFSDTFLTLAAIAPLLQGTTRITGIAHTRRQETDRVAGAARELRRLGQDVAEEEDAIAIAPRPLREGVEIETYGDHRFAMSFAILGCHDRRGDGRPWLRLRHPACCAKTFPDFFEVLGEVWKNSHPLV